MTPTEQDKELRALLGEMPYFVIDWLELSDDLRHEWKKGGKASDFGGHHAFMQKYEKKLADFITADRKRVALEARIDTATDILYGYSRTYKQKVTDSDGNVYVDESHGYISKYEVQELVAELKAQQEEV